MPLLSHNSLATYRAGRITARWIQRVAIALCFAVLLGHQAQPVSAQSVSGITSPAPGSAVSGDVPIMGTAVIDSFQRYELYYKLEPNGDDSYIYFHGATSQVIDGQLGVWSTGGLAPGVYSLRLRVVKSDANYAEYFSTNLSVNQVPVSIEPTPTPTLSEPTPTPIPTSTFTPAPQPTPVVGTVEQPPVDAPTPTPTTEAVAAVIDPGPDAGAPSTSELSSLSGGGSASTDAIESGSFTRELGEALSINRLRTQFFNGVRFSAALFLGVVAIYAGKRLFDWVWTQFS